MKHTDLTLKAMDENINMELLNREFGRHPSLIEAVSSEAAVKVYDAGDQKEYELILSGDVVEVRNSGTVIDYPSSADVYILEDGFCHRGDALERTKKLPIPDSYYDDNYRESKRSHRCGCVNCGSIFSGEEITDMVGSSGGRDGMTFCPICGSNTVLAEDSGLEITDDNLWRWNQHTFGPLPMYKNLPSDLTKLSLTDIMRQMR